MNILPHEKQVAVLASLTEGREHSQRRAHDRRPPRHDHATWPKLMDERLRNLPCPNVGVDELCCYVAKKQRHVLSTDDLNFVGDMWTFVGICNETKLLPSYDVGKRDTETACRFMDDLAGRMANRTQLASDKFGAYLWAVRAAFDARSTTAWCKVVRSRADRSG